MSPAAPIPGLPDSPTYHLGVVVYQAHRNTGRGFCARCGQPDPCPARRHGAEVILAAGEDPRAYDAMVGSRPEPVGDQTRSGGELRPGVCREETPRDGVTGFRIGGRGRPPLDSTGYQYDRHAE